MNDTDLSKVENVIMSKIADMPPVGLRESRWEAAVSVFARVNEEADDGFFAQRLGGL